MQVRLARARVLATFADKGINDVTRNAGFDEDDLDMPEIEVENQKRFETLQAETETP